MEKGERIIYHRPVVVGIPSEKNSSLNVEQFIRIQPVKSAIKHSPSEASPQEAGVSERKSVGLTW
jgi:hypothetical protein